MSTAVTRTLLILGIFVVLGGGLTTWILTHRHDATWLHAPCGDLRWERSRLPVAVFADPTLPDDWIGPLRDGMQVIDPWGRLLQYSGRLQPGVDPPKYGITVEVWNDDKHGNTHYEATGGCVFTRMQVSLPVLLLPGRVRVRAAAHELGHALGLDHSDWETHVMYSVASPKFPFELSDTERKLLETAYIK